jgi:hypothetical protein
MAAYIFKLFPRRCPRGDGSLQASLCHPPRPVPRKIKSAANRRKELRVAKVPACCSKYLDLPEAVRLKEPEEQGEK